MIKNSNLKHYLGMIGVLLIGSLIISGCGPEQKGDLEATGTIEMTEVSVGAKVGGKVEKILVEEGQTIKSQALLAELDHEELDAQIAAAQANLDLANFRYQKYNSVNPKANSGLSSRTAQVEVASNNLKIAKATLDQVSKDLQRMQQLYQGQLISQADYDQAVTRKNIANAQYLAAFSQLEVSKSGPITDDVDLSKRQSEVQIAQARTNLTLLQTQLKNTKIIAPADGVISAKLVEVGEVITPGASVFTLLNYGKPWVKVYLPLTDVERVTLNQKAYLKLDAFPNRKFYGRVSFIAQEAEFTPKDYLSKEERVKQVYALKIELDNSSGILKAGMPGDVWIEAAK